MISHMGGWNGQTMASSNLSVEFSKFCKLTKQLRQILRDTQRCFQEINSAVSEENAPPAEAELSENEEEEISAIIKKPPCILIFGQSNYGKAVVVNDIFGKTILPSDDYNKHHGVQWRAVKFGYGEKTNVGLSLSCSFELISNLAAYKQQWQTIPLEDLEIDEEDEDDLDNAKGMAILDIKLPHIMLKDGGQVLVSPSVDCLTMYELYMKFIDEVVPIFIYALTDDYFTTERMQELQELREVAPNLPIFFVRIPSPTHEFEHMMTHGRSAIRSLQSTLDRHQTPSHDSTSSLEEYHTEPMMISDSLSLSNSPTQSLIPPEGAPVDVFQTLLDLGYVHPLVVCSNQQNNSYANSAETEAKGIVNVESVFVERPDLLTQLTNFSRLILLNHLVKTTSLLNVIHTRCLETFILTAFDMARDMLITPRRLEFAQQKENELYNSLMDIALKKQDEIRRIIGETISDIREELLERAANYEFMGVSIHESGEGVSQKEMKICTGQIEEVVISGLNRAIAGKLLGSLDIFRDSCTGVLTRCLESLERKDKDTTENLRTSMALREILNAAYQVEITFRAGSSVVRVLLEKMKQLIQAMPWKTPPKINTEWKRRVASDMLESLSESRLAKSICVQIKDRLKHSHELFGTALRQLNTKHSGRLERTEEQRLKVRKVHAPKVARLALESTSLRDYILYGMPVMGRELGRGQYGVVYSCETWGSFSPCAIKSVVPPDDKHWNDLALEFYYTKNVPEHERIVALRGSVIDYTYGGGSSPAVLLIMDRLHRDFYTAIKVGLDWISRLQVSIDVVEGIRFLHNQGLVHRDIKLKNVLLDKRNRGKITDLGFCKPEAMMSGSIVGTPIHMAPELFSGRYDNSVDVYAFGILFWYVCAGHVRLPYTFEQCTSKDMLWTSVRKGVRPERLPQFDDECWQLMAACWEGEPGRRPLLGDVEPRLTTILDRHRKLPSSSTSTRKSHHHHHKRNGKNTTNLTAVTPNLSAITPKKSASTPNCSAITPNLSAITPRNSAITPNCSAITPNLSAITPNQSAVSPMKM